VEQKYVTDDQFRRRPYGYYTGGGYAIFGHQQLTRAKNPDGQEVVGPVLHGVHGHYLLDQSGEKVESIDVCRQFIDLLGSLLHEVKARMAQPSSAPTVGVP
jgi:hypothetical protein